MKFTTVCLATLGALSLAACGQSASTATSATTTTETASTAAAPAPAAPAPAAATPASPASSETTAAPAGAPRVVVNNETGVQITPAAGGQTITVAFGTPRAQAQTTLVGALGQPRESMNRECPWGPATLWEWPSGTAVVVNNELVGWIRDDGGFGYTCIAD